MSGLLFLALARDVPDVSTPPSWPVLIALSRAWQDLASPLYGHGAGLRSDCRYYVVGGFRRMVEIAEEHYSAHFAGIVPMPDGTKPCYWVTSQIERRGPCESRARARRTSVFIQIHRLLARNEPGHTLLFWIFVRDLQFPVRDQRLHCGMSSKCGTFFPRCHPYRCWGPCFLRTLYSDRRGRIRFVWRVDVGLSRGVFLWGRQPRRASPAHHRYGRSTCFVAVAAPAIVAAHLRRPGTAWRSS